MDAARRGGMAGAFAGEALAAGPTRPKRSCSPRLSKQGVSGGTVNPAGAACLWRQYNEKRRVRVLQCRERCRRQGLVLLRAFWEPFLRKPAKKQVEGRLPARPPLPPAPAEGVCPAGPGGVPPGGVLPACAGERGGRGCPGPPGAPSPVVIRR